MSRLSLKELITKAVLEQLEDNTWTVEDAMLKWWMNTRKDGGLRLTDMGDLSLRYAKIEFFNYDFFIDKGSSWHLFILDMNKKINCPYYIGVNKTENKKNHPYIRIYDSKVAVLISLYGNINDYLKSIKVKT